ncbi:MAG TPA: GIDE domain-containing protein [Kofleriaceae bacterium]
MQPAVALAYHAHAGPILGVVAVYLVMFGVVGAIGLVSRYFSKANRIKRLLRNTQPQPIAQLPENTLGKLVGVARPLGETLVGPVTGRRCLYYIAIVEQYVSTVLGSEWKQIIKEERGVPFQIVEGTGRVIVDPRGAKVALTFDGSSRSGTFHDADPVQEAFLQRHGKTSKGWVFNKDLRYKEAMIEVNETIAVLGQGVREPDPEMALAQDYRTGPPTRLRLTSSPRFPLVISDNPSTTL